MIKLNANFLTFLKHQVSILIYYRICDFPVGIRKAARGKPNRTRQLTEY